MGLDMYLKKVKRVKGASAKDIDNLENYFDWLERDSQYEKCSLKDWCGIDGRSIKKSLVEAYKDEYVTRFFEWDKERKYGHKMLFEYITSWRKANQIHSWFVKNVQGGVDDCEVYEVSREKIEELLEICNKVLTASVLKDGKIRNGWRCKDGVMEEIIEDGQYICDSSVAEELLPTSSGFFFGSCDYDQWYYQDVNYTREILEQVLAETDFEKEMICYRSSW